MHSTQTDIYVIIMYHIPLMHSTQMDMYIVIMLISYTIYA